MRFFIKLFSSFPPSFFPSTLRGRLSSALCPSLPADPGQLNDHARLLHHCHQGRTRSVVQGLWPLKVLFHPHQRSDPGSSHRGAFIITSVLQGQLRTQVDLCQRPRPHLYCTFQLDCPFPSFKVYCEHGKLTPSRNNDLLGSVSKSSWAHLYRHTAECNKHTVQRFLWRGDLAQG